MSAAAVTGDGLTWPEAAVVIAAVLGGFVTLCFLCWLMVKK